MPRVSRQPRRFSPSPREANPGQRPGGTSGRKRELSATRYRRACRCRGVQPIRRSLEMATCFNSGSYRSAISMAPGSHQRVPARYFVRAHRPSAHRRHVGCEEVHACGNARISGRMSSALRAALPRDQFGQTLTPVDERFHPQLHSQTAPEITGL